MKNREKIKAFALRKRGDSIGDIAKKLDVSRGSVSVWVRDVYLTPAQTRKLNKKGHSVDAIEKRRNSRIKNTQQRQQVILQEAKKEASSLVTNPLWCVGTALYWGEGGKTQQLVRVSNSDVYVLKIMMRYFTEICKAPIIKFRGHIHAYEHSDTKKIEAYWSRLTNIPMNQFFKTYTKTSSASKQKRDKLPYGTLAIYVLDTKLFFRIMGWMDYLKENKI